MIERRHYKFCMPVRLELSFYVFTVIGSCEVSVKRLNTARPASDL